MGTRAEERLAGTKTMTSEGWRGRCLLLVLLRCQTYEKRWLVVLPDM